MSKKPKLLPPVEYLRECFDYDLETGVLTWRERPCEHFTTTQVQTAAQKQIAWNANYAGKIAGRRKGSASHLSVFFISFGKLFVHRVIWKWVTGQEPPCQLDHRDTDPNNNCFGNLRPATYADNEHNKGPRANNTSGFKGVHFYKSSKKWAARIETSGTVHNLGHFDTKEAAAAAYAAAAARLHGEYAWTGSGQ